jgi:uncharacterized protein YciI
MQYLVTACDGQDAHERRIALRDKHLAAANHLRAAGNLLYAVATLDANGQPNGSMEVVQFHSRADLDRWLQQEPYVTGKVWAKVDVTPCRIGPMFAVR